MDEHLSAIKLRILLLAEIKGLTKANFLTNASLTYNNFKSEALKSQPGCDVIVNLLKTYPDINPYWLLLGEGDILVPPYKNRGELIVLDADVSQPSCTVSMTQPLVPLYDLQNTKSLKSLFAEELKPVDHIYVPDLPHVDGAITMRGEMMMPEVRSGDLLLYKQVKDYTRKENIFFGQMYLMSFVLDNHEQITIKYVHKSENTDCITLVNRNSYYSPMEIPYESVQAIALIKACIHYYDI